MRVLLPLTVILLGWTLSRSAERPAVKPGQALRSETIADNGMVCAAHPLAAQIGLDVLKQGGNAVDAAIATNAALGLMEPTSCGIGGDLYAIVYDAKTQKLYGLNASGPAPKRATPDHFRGLNLTTIPETGPLSWSVPGAVGGWEALHRRFGRREFRTLIEPSIAYAKAGVPVPEVIAGYWRASAKKLAGDPGLAHTFLPGGRPPRAGERFKNPELAASYESIAAGGARAFYEGDIARKIVKLSGEKGGLFALEDFRDYQPEWVEPVSTSYRGYDVYELPPPGQGIAALQMLNLLERYDVRSMKASPADYWHTLIEAKKLAFADRARYYADPRMATVPTDRLIGKDYARDRQRLIDPRRAGRNIAAGDELIGKADTTYLTVVDRERNMVSLIQSNYMGFGSGLAAPGTGFGLQNRGCLFSLDPDHANVIAPGKRPFHTIIPAMVLKDGKPFFSFGVMGGDMQPQGHVQVLVNLIDFDMGVQAAGDAPRIEHVGSATPRGEPEKPNGGTVLAEAGLGTEVIDKLKALGHQVRTVRVNGGGYQGILIDPATGALRGGTESRKDGVALGY